MKEKYEEMICDVVEFETADIITTSVGDSKVQWGGDSSANP